MSVVQPKKRRSKKEEVSYPPEFKPEHLEHLKGLWDGQTYQWYLDDLRKRFTDDHFTYEGVVQVMKAFEQNGVVLQ